MPSDAGAATIAVALRDLEAALNRAGDDHPRRSAEWLVGAALGLSRSELLIAGDRTLSETDRARLRAFATRRARGEPLQYITGSAPFRYLEVAVDPAVLIPRPETERLVDAFLAALDATVAFDAAAARVVADIGCGSGCIALSLATERPELTVLATDLSQDALDRAKANGGFLGLDERRIRFYQGDMTDALRLIPDHSLSGIISNPPYIPTAVLAELPEEVRDFEPREALDGGPDGLRYFRALIDGAPRLLAREGVLAVELFEDSCEDAADLAVERGFRDVEVRRDLAGRDRIVIARRP